MKFRECPCYKDGKDCPIRTSDCHADCHDYKEWRAELDADNKAKKESKIDEYQKYIVDKIVERKKRKNEKCSG